MPLSRPIVPGLLACSLVLIPLGCEKQPSTPAPAPAASPSTPPPSPAPSTPPATGAAPAAAGTLNALGVVFPVPEGWKQVPPSNQMRLAEIQVPDPSGDAAKASVIAFSSAGGDVQSNIMRWAGQMLDASGQAPKPEIVTREVNGLKVHTVELRGAYQGMGEAPKADWMLRGAIVETPGGLLFVKMTGPAAGMEPAKAGWDAMINGIRKG